MARLVGLKDRISGGLRQRSGCRPARDRHAFGGADESESLSGGGDPLFADAPAAVAGRRGSRQNAGQQQHDRPSGEEAGPPACPKCRWDSSGSCLDCSTARCCFGGEESAGASFLRLDGTVWTTDKDGPIMDLLAAEITARTGKDPGEHYQRIDRRIRHAVLHAHRRAGDAGAESKSAETFSRGRQGVRAGRRTDPAKLTTPRAITPPSAA